MPWVLSGRSESAVREYAAKLRAHLGATLAPQNVACTLAASRPFEYRAVLVAEDTPKLLDELAGVAEGRTPVTRAAFGPIAYLFTSRAIDPTSTIDLLSARYPVFAETAADLRSRVDDDVFVLELALVRLFGHWGVRPDVVVGKSIGALAAAYVAGVLTLGDACALVSAYRGGIFDKVLETVTLRPPVLPIVIGGDVTSPEFWASHMASPPRMFGSIFALADDGVSTFAEVGADGVLSELGQDCVPAAEFAPLVRGGQEYRSVVTTLAWLHERGVAVDWQAFFGECEPVEVPPRPWRQPIAVPAPEGPLRLDAPTRQVRLHGRVIAVTRKEFDLLRLLSSRRGCVVPRKEIMLEVWGDEHDLGRTLDTHVNSLRRKLGSSDWIVTVRGVGFRLGQA
ncbi:winged helix-turn-helix domain-containing protein [Amycolatopsis sp. cg5]|uniref:winged helix-turn-helix domain-containing protein n=1 Tax=Amycolatopsis sp. cg5 TaxID=3238802 RepID=UPI003523C79B